MTLSRRQYVLGGLLIAVVGGFLLWLQAGLIYSVASLANGGYGLQSHLSAAADGVKTGGYAEAQAEFEKAQAATVQLARSVGTTQMDLVGRIPGFAVAVTNWRLASSAASCSGSRPVSCTPSDHSHTAAMGCRAACRPRPRA